MIAPITLAGATGKWTKSVVANVLVHLETVIGIDTSHMRALVDSGKIAVETTTPGVRLSANATATYHPGGLFADNMYLDERKLVGGQMPVSEWPEVLHEFVHALIDHDAGLAGVYQRQVTYERGLNWAYTKPNNAESVADETAAFIAQSSLVTGLLSGLHLLGLTLVVGGALVSGLRRLGFVLVDRPVADVTRPISRGMSIGLAVSVSTGLLLFAPRATAAARNSFFQTKMILLLAAAVFQFAVAWRPDANARARMLKITGSIQLALWFGVALAGCAFILIE